MQIAMAVVQALQDDSAIDAVQPMQNGWCIYIHTLTDRVNLINSGITLAGCYIPLQSKTASHRWPSVKITIKDLPLHAVDNEDILEVVKEHCEVQSAVAYANIWYNGHLMNIQNGNRFVYILQQDLPDLPDHVQVSDYQGCIFKPKAETMCKCCQ